MQHRHISYLFTKGGLSRTHDAGRSTTSSPINALLRSVARPLGRLAVLAHANLEGALRELARLRGDRALHAETLESALDQSLRVDQVHLGDGDVVLRAPRRRQRGERREGV